MVASPPYISIVVLTGSGEAGTIPSISDYRRSRISYDLSYSDPTLDDYIKNNIKADKGLI